MSNVAKILLQHIENKERAKERREDRLYDVVRLAEARELEQAGQKMTQITYFQDYKDVKGIKFPYKTILNLGMDIELTTSEVKINEGVTDKDFE